MKTFIFNTIGGGALTGLSYILGGWDMALQTLVVVVVLDYVTGVLKAIKNKKLSSECGANGIVKKLGYFIIVALAVMVDINTGNSGTIRNLVIFFFVANEGISILENWAGMGLATPQALRNVLAQLGKENSGPVSIKVEVKDEGESE